MVDQRVFGYYIVKNLEEFKTKMDVSIAKGGLEASSPPPTTPVLPNLYLNLLCVYKSV